MKELPQKAPWLLRKGVAAFYGGRYRLARWLCWLQLRLTPGEYFALCWYANCLYFSARSAEMDQAADHFYRLAIRANPALPLAHAGLGRIHYTNALRISREYHMFPGGSWLMFSDEASPEELSGAVPGIVVKGFADGECGNRRVAITELEEAARLSEETDDKVELLGMAAEMHTLISNEKGRKAYARVLAIDADYVPAHFNLAACHAACGDSPKALREYTYVRERAPHLATELAEVLRELGVELQDVAK